ncbi:hypothetical protein PsYK624_014060 [Phanerochaete sordida]|uniref:Uncharacterized protein n=1 Tax=Phanerochaete sordida TaxID=48140 RepID=A0A9P3FY33_9APHY|nr:hypothetical protein PsYK624_014060 [Phanerochaete sordida]
MHQIESLQIGHIIYDEYPSGMNTMLQKIGRRLETFSYADHWPDTWMLSTLAGAFCVHNDLVRDVRE